MDRETSPLCLHLLAKKIQRALWCHLPHPACWLWIKGYGEQQAWGVNCIFVMSATWHPKHTGVTGPCFACSVQSQWHEKADGCINEVCPVCLSRSTERAFRDLSWPHTPGALQGRSPGRLRQAQEAAVLLQRGKADGWQNSRGEAARARVAHTHHGVRCQRVTPGAADAAARVSGSRTRATAVAGSLLRP